MHLNIAGQGDEKPKTTTRLEEEVLYIPQEEEALKVFIILCSGVDPLLSSFSAVFERFLHTEANLW